MFIYQKDKNKVRNDDNNIGYFDIINLYSLIILMHMLKIQLILFLTGRLIQ
jgi:hypothetical protein